MVACFAGEAGDGWAREGAEACPGAYTTCDGPGAVTGFGEEDADGEEAAVACGPTGAPHTPHRVAGATRGDPHNVHFITVPSLR